MAGTGYTVTATQLNRVSEDGKSFLEPLKRGAEFTAADVRKDELDRWLSLRPRVVVPTKELEKALQTAESAQAELEDLREQLAAKDAELAAALAASGQGIPAVPPAGLTEPESRASAKAWQAYARQVELANVGDGSGEVPADAEAFIAGATRDELAKKYGTAS